MCGPGNVEEVHVVKLPTESIRKKVQIGVKQFHPLFCNLRPEYSWSISVVTVGRAGRSCRVNWIGKYENCLEEFEYPSCYALCFQVPLVVPTVATWNVGRVKLGELSF